MTIEKENIKRKSIDVYKFKKKKQSIIRKLNISIAKGKCI